MGHGLRPTPERDADHVTVTVAIRAKTNIGIIKGIPVEREQYFILEGTMPIPVVDRLRWARWFETANRHVAETVFLDDIRVSTVFLGLNHQWGNGAPLLFETMVFGGALDGEEQRYAAWTDAEKGHAVLCAKVKVALDVDTQPEPSRGY